MAKTGTTTNSSAATAAEPSILDGSLGTIANEPLAQMVIEGVRSARITAEALTELRKRFAKLKKDEDIIGFHSNQWQKFCEERLGMTPSTARRWIKETVKVTGEPHPGAKYDGSENRSYGHGAAPWFHTADGTEVNLARSCAQKAVRDGDEIAGTYWIRQLYLVGYNVWAALATFAAEDIGIADLTVKTHVLELMQLAGKCKDERHSDLLHVIMAMMICCRAKKKRTADDYCIWYRENPTYAPPLPEEVKAAMENTVQPPIPDKAKDIHTSEGRRMGRDGASGMKHFKEVASKLTNESEAVGFVPPTEVDCPHCNGTGRVKLPPCEEAA